jgi:hypothetical protein
MTEMTGTLHENRYAFMISLAQFFLEWEMFQANLKRKHFGFNNFFFFENRAIMWGNVAKYGTAGQATYDNMAHAICTLDT